MRTFCIFIRAVMPTGKNKVPMAELRTVLTNAGLLDVRTYIQSGNVLCKTTLKREEVETLVHDEIQKHFGGDLIIVAKTPLEVSTILNNNPYHKKDLSRIFFTLLSKIPDTQNVKILRSQNFPPDEFIVKNDIVYVYCPVTYGLSKLNNNFFEKRLGVSATTRNYNTLRKMGELSDS